MSFTKILIIFSAFFYSLAEAKVYIEPLLGYQTGKLDYKLLPALGGATGKGSMNGIGYGLGLGWTFAGGVTVGAEAEQFNLTTKFEGSTTTTKSTGLAGYAVVGYYVKPKARAFLGVGAFSFKDESVPSTTQTGSALKAGLSYEFQNHIAANIEYITYGINESKTEGSSAVKTTAVYDHFLATAAIWNFRFPFEF